jgi:uncharacterized protein (DUF1800 family)
VYYVEHPEGAAAVKRKSGLLIGIFVLVLNGCAGLTSSHGGGSTQPPPPEAGQIAVTPGNATLRGGDTQPFTVTMSDNSAAPPVGWSVNGVAGGNASDGTITASGVYSAPEFPPASNRVTVAAAETADASKTSSSIVTLENPIPQISSIAPSSITVGSFNITAKGAHFAAGATLYLGSTALTTTRVSSTQLTATGTASASETGTIAVTVKNPDPGTISSAAINAQIVAASAIAVVVSPASVTAHAGSTGSISFGATVTGSANHAVTWAVNNTTGSSTIGYITAQGSYTPPVALPNPAAITITATSAADPTKHGTATVTIQNPVPTITAVNPGTIGIGAFVLNLTGTGFISTSTVNFGGHPVTTMFLSSTELVISGTVSAAQAGPVSITVVNPDPGGATSAPITAQIINGTSSGVSAASAVRFLEQSSFGPTPTLVNQVQQIGLDTYLQNQFSAPASTYPTPAATDSGLGNVQLTFYKNAVNDNDQLRQRAAFALNEIWVVGANKVNDPTGYTNYMRALTKDALGNYYDVMKDVTLTPAMGHWLDMVNNDKPGNGQHANENYARELMQLFTLGLSQLNADGTAIPDGTGNPAPTYTQDDVMALGRSLTGWTYPPEAGMPPQKHNPFYFGGNMVPFESNHDSGAKTFLGQSIAAGQSAEQELDSALTIIFNHPNLPPFVGKQLIEKLVTSNPSPGYVQRVSQAFTSGKYNSYGSGKRGDMQATLAAILFDQEARRGDSLTSADPNDGKLREPIVMEIGVARMFNAATDGSGFNSWSANMSQDLFNAPSVFNYFPPENLIPQTTLNGPEFAIFNTNTSLTRVNFTNSIVYGQISAKTTIDLTPVINAGTPDQMVAWLNTQLLHDSMSDSMKQSVLTAVAAISTSNPPTAKDLKNQARAAAYLVLSSSQYQVQR